MGNISRHFSFKEFEASKTADLHHISNTITSFEVRDAVIALVTEVLEPLRVAWGAPLKVNSGYRSPQVNAYVGGVATSQHTKGEAADIQADDPYRLASCALSLGLPFDQMILYPTFVHFSHKLVGEQRGQVLYNKAYTGRRFNE